MSVSGEAGIEWFKSGVIYYADGVYLLSGKIGTIKRSWLIPVWNFQLAFCFPHC
jgi:hypothetical protein